MKKKSNTEQTQNHKLNRNLLLAISCFEGGAVMIIELVGAKIIAPFYGTSLYVWSSVLGVTLAALAFGYFAGGYISKKYPGEWTLFLALFVGGSFAMIAPVIGPSIMQATDGFGVKVGSLISVFIFLFPSISCMGMVSPMIIQLINKDIAGAGSSAGTVYAISTVGGILATFLAGFYLIPEWGIILTSYIIGGILLSISAIYFIKTMKWNFLGMEAIMVVILLLANPEHALTSDNTAILYSKVGILGEWTVVEFNVPSKDGSVSKEKKLLLNGIDQTYTQTGHEPLSLWNYPHQLGAYSSCKPKGSKALLLGMGGGSIVHELVSMDLEVDVVELDQNVEYISKTYFNYDETKSNLYIDDARHFIRTADKKYDIVIMDLVLGEVQPAHVFSLEGFQELKEIINEDAIVIINFQGVLEIPEYSQGPKSIYRTLQEAGFYVDYYYPYAINPEEHLTQDMFFLASLSDLDYKSLLQNVRYNEWFPYDNFYYEDLIQERPLDVSDALILTDDKPKLELINSSSILNWRKNKINQNIKRLMDEKLSLYK